MFTIAGPVLVFGQRKKIIIYSVLAAVLVWFLFFGSIMAMAQYDFRRMLAYSSVAQIGYIAIGLAMGNMYGFIGAVLHVINHAFMKSSLFLVIGGIEYRFGEVNLYRLGGMNKKMTISTITVLLASLSMIGLPPTCGFFSKWYLMLGAYTGAQYFYIAVLVISSLLNAIYFFRIIEQMFVQREASLTEVHPHQGEEETDSAGPSLKKNKVNVMEMLGLLKEANVITCVESRYDFKNTKISTGLDGINRIILPSCKIYPTLVASDTNDFIATKMIKGETLNEYKKNFMNVIYMKGAFRKITKSEACRIQGFPDHYLLPPTRARWMKLIGNSVAVPIVKMLAKAIVDTGVFKGQSRIHLTRHNQQQLGMFDCLPNEVALINH